MTDGKWKLTYNHPDINIALNYQMSTGDTNMADLECMNFKQKIFVKIFFILLHNFCK